MSLARLLMQVLTVVGVTRMLPAPTLKPADSRRVSALLPPDPRTKRCESSSIRSVDWALPALPKTPSLLATPELRKYMLKGRARSSMASRGSLISLLRSRVSVQPVKVTPKIASIIQEMAKTERDYFRQIRCLREEVSNPTFESVVLPKKVVNDIITGHKDLARKLRKAKVSSDPVRAVVTILSKKFSLPLTESSLSMAHAKYAAFLHDWSKHYKVVPKAQSGRAWERDNCLIRPVQRVGKYSLFLGDLLTSLADDNGAEEVEATRENITEVVKEVNAFVILHEERRARKIPESIPLPQYLQGGRLLLRSECVSLAGQPKRRSKRLATRPNKWDMILTTDALTILPISKRDTFEQKWPTPVRVYDLSDIDSLSNLCQLDSSIDVVLDQPAGNVGGLGGFRLTFKDQRDCQSWFSNIIDARKQNVSAR
ncbi:DH domain-containing protein [Plasmodiophora brassicae]